MISDDNLLIAGPHDVLTLRFGSEIVSTYT